MQLWFGVVNDVGIALGDASSAGKVFSLTAARGPARPGRLVLLARRVGLVSGGDTWEVLRRWMASGDPLVKTASHKFRAGASP